jgi:hypothetical protein
MMNYKGFGGKRPWQNLRYYSYTCLGGLRKTKKTSVSEAGLQAEIRSRDFPNTEQQCQLLGCNVQIEELQTTSNGMMFIPSFTEAVQLVYAIQMPLNRNKSGHTHYSSLIRF